MLVSPPKPTCMLLPKSRSGRLIHGRKDERHQPCKETMKFRNQRYMDEICIYWRYTSFKTRTRKYSCELISQLHISTEAIIKNIMAWTSWFWFSQSVAGNTIIRLHKLLELTWRELKTLIVNSSPTTLSNLAMYHIKECHFNYIFTWYFTNPNILSQIVQ